MSKITFSLSRLIGRNTFRVPTRLPRSSESLKDVSTNSFVFHNAAFNRSFTTSRVHSNLDSTRQQKLDENKAKSEPSSETKNSQSANISDEDALKLLVDLQQEREGLVNNIKDLEDKYKRSLAETENVRSRMQRQVEDTKSFAIQGFCKDLLEIADVLALAKEAVPVGTFEQQAHGNVEELKVLFKQFYDGVLMTQTNLHKIFAKHGLVMVDPLNEKFDPNIHEAVFELTDETKTPGTVGVVLKSGYSLHQRPIRPAKVGIVKDK